MRRSCKKKIERSIKWTRTLIKGNLFFSHVIFGGTNKAEETLGGFAPPEFPITLKTKKEVLEKDLKLNGENFNFEHGDRRGGLPT